MLVRFIPYSRRQTPAMEATRLSLALLVAFAASVYCFPEKGNDFCDSNPCMNGGTCLTIGEMNFCLCREGIGGRRCEDNPCGFKPCQNDGVCINTGIKDRFYCACKVGYEGVTCEKPWN